ncbi:unnamed protein product [Trypanosoma congolense IL3000]|uniref:WGS project CAEQ00000000 data, annotated contig 2024 n=1 Tax=Trypanosoma congolense (strain IL3000) TaxID=1068625 RepID=F9WAW6_TRYCI|nr:unnamed protein product [Trypanosoma congolense IL3000]
MTVAAFPQLPRQYLFLPSPFAFANIIMNPSRRPAEVSAKALALIAFLGSFLISSPAAFGDPNALLISFSFSTPLTVAVPMCAMLICHFNNFFSISLFLILKVFFLLSVQGATLFNFLLKLEINPPTSVGIARRELEQSIDCPVETTKAVQRIPHTNCASRSIAFYFTFLSNLDTELQGVDKMKNYYFKITTGGEIECPGVEIRRTSYDQLDLHAFCVIELISVDVLDSTQRGCVSKVAFGFHEIIFE